MKKLIPSAAILLAMSISLSCHTMNGATSSTPVPEGTPVISHVMTKEQQEKLTPKEVFEDLKAGNERFAKGTLTKRDHSERIRATATGQYPKAVILSCLDSRVPVEDVFDQGIGDLFVARVAGNFVNVDILGSIEYACKVSGAHLIVVMGHQYCGAIKSTIDNVELGNITEMLSKIKPAVAMSQDFAGEKKSKNDEYVRYVSENNVRHAMQEIRDKSPILKEMEQKGQVRIVGVFYRLTDGLLEYVQ